MLLRAATVAAILATPTALRAQDPSLVQPYSEADCPSCGEWNEPNRPVHLFGNTFYVGTRGLAAILIASADGHVLIDGGLPDSAPLILTNVRALGFKPTDVKFILNSHAHYDHAGGIAALQQVTGARVLANEHSARVMRRGVPGKDDPQHDVALPMPPVPKVEAVEPDHVLRLGDLTLTMHLTAGHTPGGTTWSWRSCEGERCLDFVYADSQTPISQDGFRFSDSRDYPTALQDFERGHALLEHIPCDVLITPHPAASNLWQRASSIPDGLVDRSACANYAASARRQLESRLDREQR